MPSSSSARQQLSLARNSPSSTATTMYQLCEWTLILYSRFLCGNTSRYVGPALLRSIRHWQILLASSILVVFTIFDRRSEWMSTVLYVTCFPEMIACTKLMTTSHGSGLMYYFNVQISVVSFLHLLLLHKSLPKILPPPAQILSLLSYVMSPDFPLIGPLHISILQLVAKVTRTSLNSIEVALLSHSLTAFTLYVYNFSVKPHEAFLFAFIYGLLLAMWPAVPFLKQSVRIVLTKPQMRSRRAPQQRLNLAFKAYGVAGLVLITIVRGGLRYNLGIDPFVWVLRHIYYSRKRQALVLYWAGTLSVGLLIVIFGWGSKPQISRLYTHAEHDEDFFAEENLEHERSKALDRRRKFFHGLVVCMFLPTLHIDPDFAYLALSLVLAIFSIEEIIRICALPPFGAAVHKFLSGFTDYRDKQGLIIVSHIFLLLGVSGPVWLTITGSTTPSKTIASLCGVLTLGAGDAAASLFGKKFGKHHWPESKKTLEGTAAFVVAMLLGGIVVSNLRFINEAMDWQTFIVASVLTGLMEAVSTQNDNLIIPIYMWSLVI